MNLDTTIDVNIVGSIQVGKMDWVINSYNKPEIELANIIGYWKDPSFDKHRMVKKKKELVPEKGLIYRAEAIDRLGEFGNFKGLRTPVHGEDMIKFKTLSCNKIEDQNSALAVFWGNLRDYKITDIEPILLNYFNQVVNHIQHAGMDIINCSIVIENEDEKWFLTTSYVEPMWQALSVSKVKQQYPYLDENGDEIE